MAASTFTDPISFIHDQDSIVAVKTLPQTPASQNELRILHELQGHPNIIILRKFENTDNHLRIYMDYHPQCLLDLLTTHSDGLPLSLVKHIFIQLIMALNYIHKCGYIHHDIKLENILIDQEDRIYIIDFGCSFSWTPGEIKKTSRLGSIHYAAPEMWMRKPCVGPEVDVWAAGVCLVLLITGFFPFGGMTEQKLWNGIQIKGLWKNKTFKADPVLFDLLKRMLQFECDKRIDVEGILNHRWVR